jgi:hypothetical protein
MIYKMCHPKANIDRLHVKRKGGRRGLLQTDVTHKAEIINVAEHLNTKHKDNPVYILLIAIKAVNQIRIQQLKQQQQLQKN